MIMIVVCSSTLIGTITVFFVPVFQGERIAKNKAFNYLSIFQTVNCALKNLKNFNITQHIFL